MDNIIQALQQNEKAFGLMSEEMQAKAEEIGTIKFFRYDGEGEWCVIGDVVFYEHNTYRLREDYKEEAGVEKTGLEMKYFILKPKSKTRCDAYSGASQSAMLTYAEEIEDENPVLAKELKAWAEKEAHEQATIHLF